jgi:hypothetical protein
MPADKLGRYMTSPQFLERANAAVRKAVERLEAKGVKPACVTRRASDTADARAAREAREQQ